MNERLCNCIFNFIVRVPASTPTIWASCCESARVCSSQIRGVHYDFIVSRSGKKTRVYWAQTHSLNRMAFSKEVEVLVNQGVKLLASKKYDDAAERFSNACELHLQENGEMTVDCCFSMERPSLKTQFPSPKY